MHALTLDHLSNGRVVLGMGVSGPQVVEGWYGVPFSKPLARTREVVEIIRKVLAREAPVTNDGPHHPLPYTGPGAVGLGKPLKPIVHPLRADIPIWLGAEGPKNVAQTAEIADGWLPIFYTPRSAGMYQPWLDEGFARPGARRTRDDFEIAATCHLQVTSSEEERRGVIDGLKPAVALYMGGMGAKEQNFHKNVFDRMGYEHLTGQVQELFLAQKREEAVALIPDELVEDMHIVGDAGYVRERAAAWEETGVTTLLLSCRDAAEVRRVAEVLA
jgi:F420-dependent oxidoreductase-like protein